MNNRDELTETQTFGHGGIKFTTYPASGRVAVEVAATNAVMDLTELFNFVDRIRKPRTITTVDELDALAMGSKVVSAGYEWTKNYLTINTPSGGIEREVWFNVYDDFDAAADIALPATVLYEPQP